MATIRKKKSAFEEARDFVGGAFNNLSRGAQKTVADTSKNVGNFYNSFSKGYDQFQKQQQARQERNRQNAVKFTNDVFSRGRDVVNKTTNYFDATKDNDLKKAGVQNFWADNPGRIASTAAWTDNLLREGAKSARYGGENLVRSTLPAGGSSYLATLQKTIKDTPILSADPNDWIPGPQMITNRLMKGMVLPTGSNKLPSLKLRDVIGNTDITGGLQERLGRQAINANIEIENRMNRELGELELTGDFWQDIKNPRYVGRGLGMNGPSLAATLGVGGIATLLSGGAALPVMGAMAGAGYLQNAGSTYVEAKRMGADEDTAQQAARVVGFINAGLDAVGAGEILNSATKPLRSKIVFEVMKDMFTEGSTESLQQIVSNKTAQVLYDEDRGLFDQALESGFFGAILGGGASTVGTSINAATQGPTQTQGGGEIENLNTPQPEEQAVQRQVDGALNELQQMLTPETIVNSGTDSNINLEGLVVGAPIQPTQSFSQPLDLIPEPAVQPQVSEQNNSQEVSQEEFTSETQQLAEQLQEEMQAPAVQMMKEEIDQAISDTGQEIVPQEAQNTGPTADVNLNMDKGQAEAAIKSMLGEAELNYVNGGDQILTKDGQLAHGKYYDSIISVIENNGKVEDKTVYHEAFHAYVDKFVDKQLYKSAVDDVLANQKVTDKQVDEILAEGFAEYAAGRRGGFTQNILNFFSDLMYSFRTLIGKVNSAEMLYQNALQGKRAENGGMGTTEEQFRVKNPEDPFYNVNRMGVDDKVKQATADLIQSPEVKAQVEETIGAPLTLDEVKMRAQVAKEPKTTKTRKAAETLTAQQQALRNRVAQLGEQYERGEISGEDYAEALVRDKAFGAFAARLLGSRRAVSAPGETTILNTIIAEALRKGADPEAMIKAAKGVDFNNVAEVADFYHQFVPVTFGDWVNKLRYGAMLSSPLTHIINMASNAQGTALLVPTRKVIEGAIDAGLTAASLGKRERTRYAGEGVAYLQAYLSPKNMKDSVKAMKDYLSGKEGISQNPDTRFLPLATRGPLKRVDQVLGSPTKPLEGVDRFFVNLTEKAFENAAKYRADRGGKTDKTPFELAQKELFRGPLTEEGAGIVNNFIGDFAKRIGKFRRDKNPAIRVAANANIPFLHTIANLTKAGVEANPAFGAVNLIRNNDPIQQTAKIIMGGMVTAAATTLGMAGMLQADEPKDKTQREAMRAAGILPWSVNVNGQSIQFNKFHPLIAFQLGLTAGVMDSVKDGKLTEDAANNIFGALTASQNYLSDQSYFKAVGDFVKMMTGDFEYRSGAQVVNNYARQLIPFSALQGWITRTIDHYQRQPDADAGFMTEFMQNIAKNTPGLSQSVPLRTGPDGEPVENPYPLINAFSPYRVSPINEQGVVTLDLLKEKSLQNKIINDAKTKEEKNKVSMDLRSPEDKKAGAQLKIKDEIARNNAKISAIENGEGSSDSEAFYSDGKFYYFDTDDQETKEIDLRQFQKEKAGIGKQKQQDEKYAAARKIWDSPLTPQDKAEALYTLGVTPEEARYDTLANHENEVKTNYLLEKLSDQPYEVIMERLETGRMNSVSGKVFASDGVLADLRDNGLISDADYKYLKSIKYNKAGELLGGGGSGKKVDYSLDVSYDVPDLPELELGGSTGAISEAYAPIQLNNGRSSRVNLKMPQITDDEINAINKNRSQRVSPRVSGMATTLSGLGR